LTSGGHKAYLEAVEGAFGGSVDYAQVAKIYRESFAGQKRYSPAEWVGARKEVIIGSSDASHFSTLFAERQNLTMRMSMSMIKTRSLSRYVNVRCRKSSTSSPIRQIKDQRAVTARLPNAQIAEQGRQSSSRPQQHEIEEARIPRT
jgi:hypothetical protein